MNSDLQEPIRVMRIITRMNIGGPAVQVSGLMRQLDKTIFDQRLYTGYCAKDEADYLQTPAVELDAVYIDGLGRKINFLGDVKAFLALVHEIRSFKPQIIHTHTTKAGLIGRFASLISLHRSYRIHTFHGHLLNGYFGKFKTFLVISIEKLTATFTHKLLSVGERVQNDLLVAGIGSKEKFLVMPPGASIKLLPERIQAIRDFNLSDEKIYCAFIGRLTEIKRPDRFLEVVRELKRRNVNLDFIMAGDGHLKNYCEKVIENESLPVTILGWQTEIEKVLAASDVVILTSDNEGMPLSLIQAAMCGIPAVATNVGSVSEVVQNGETGILTDIAIINIANALEELTVNAEKRVKLGESARAFARTNFSVERLVSDHTYLYTNLIRDSKNQK